MTLRDKLNALPRHLFVSQKARRPQASRQKFAEASGFRDAGIVRWQELSIKQLRERRRKAWRDFYEAKRRAEAAAKAPWFPLMFPYIVFALIAIFHRT